MRLVALALPLLVAACGPKVAVQPSPFEHDDPQAGTPRPEDDELYSQEISPQADVKAATYTRREVAPPGKGLRTGTIDRTRLLAVLDAGPGLFLRQFEVTSAMDGDKFVGWQLVQLIDDQGPLHDLDLAQGDILIALNGAPISRPDQLMTTWNSLRAADQLTCDLLRGDQRFQLTFAIDPPAGRVPPDLLLPPKQPPPPTAKKPAN
jgi:hypothetical protein